MAATAKCEYYNHTLCQDTGKGCNETEYCEVVEPSKRNHCYVLWQNTSAGQLQIKFKVSEAIGHPLRGKRSSSSPSTQGCFLNNIDCYNQSKCVGRREEPRKNLLFCCCEGDYCNREFSWEPTATEAPSTNGERHPVHRTNVRQTTRLLESGEVSQHHPVESRGRCVLTGLLILLNRPINYS